MTKNERKERLENRIDAQRANLDSVLKYLEKHCYEADKYTVSYLAQILLYRRARDKIRFLLIDAISATGGNNLTRKGHGSEKVNGIIKRLPDSELLTIEEFYGAFDKCCHSLESLFKYLTDSKKPIPGMSYKTCALFLRNLDLVKQLIFHGESHFKRAELMIPVDVVICIMLNKILKCRDEDEIFPRSFDLINEVLKEKLGDRFMLVEYLWYWGFFCLTGKKMARELQFNSDKYNSDLHLDFSTQPIKKFESFLKKCNQLGIT